MIRAASPEASGGSSSVPAGRSATTGSVTGDCGGGAGDVVEQHREAVHRRVVEDRDVDPRRDRLAQGPPARGRERDRVRLEQRRRRRGCAARCSSTEIEAVGALGPCDARVPAHAVTRERDAASHAVIPPVRTDASIPGLLQRPSRAHARGRRPAQTTTIGPGADVGRIGEDVGERHRAPRPGSRQSPSRAARARRGGSRLRTARRARRRDRRAAPARARSRRLGACRGAAAPRRCARAGRRSRAPGRAAARRCR